VVWEKFCNYFEVEARRVPMEGDRFHLDAETAVAQCDENTIGVVSILGSTFDGSYEPVADIAAALDDLEQREGHDVPIHVDGASGGFVAPFIDRELEWDFRLERVASINASGHKYGLVYPGIGWVLWRDEKALPEELVFKVDYLGGDMPTFTLNFSRPGSQVAAQYYNLIRLGFEGYQAVQQECREVAMHLSGALAEMGPFELLSHGSELPAFAFKLRDDIDAYTVYDVSERLRERKWIVPAYKFPENREDLRVLRVVVRNDLSRDLADLFLDDVERLLPKLDRQPRPFADERATGFHH
jgi:glutamate decarboxylase